MALDAEHYRLLVESVQDYAIYLLDPTGIVQSWNLGAQRLKGYAPNEILRWAAAAESKFSHPVAKAILDKARELRLELPAIGSTGRWVERSSCAPRSALKPPP